MRCLRHFAGFVVVSSMNALGAAAQVPEQETPPPDRAEPRGSLVVYRSDGERVRWRGEKISMGLKDADLVEVLRSFAKLGELNLVIEPKVSGKVTVELHEVPWDHALSVILKTHRLGAELDGTILAIGGRRGG